MALIDSILFVDDDPVTNYHHQALATSTEVARAVFVTSNGEEAMEFIRERYLNGQSLPSLIVLDLDMPVKNGADFIKELHASDLLGVKKIPVVIVSASATHVTPSIAEDLRQSFFPKPLCPSRLMEIVQAAASGRI